MIKMSIIFRRSKLLINWQSSKDNAVIWPDIYAIVSVNKCRLLANKKVILL
jgi:hypothetical protein